VCACTARRPWFVVWRVCALAERAAMLAWLLCDDTAGAVVLRCATVGSVILAVQ
jgi:hypothetical protein